MDNNNNLDFGFDNFLISEDSIKEINSIDELEKVLNDQRFHLCQLIQQEKELNIAKDKFLKILYIIETKYVRLLDSLNLPEKEK